MSALGGGHRGGGPLEGIEENALGVSVGRPESSLAKLLDEYFYESITRGI